MKPFKNNWLSPRSIGLPLTLILAALAYFALLYFSDALVGASHGVIVQLDEACALIFSRVRTPGLVHVFSIVTAFGYWGVVAAMAIVISILLWMSGRSQYLISMWITLAGNQISVNLLKVIFARARPEFAYYGESSYSFPSGHSAVSAALFGFLMYLVIRERLVPAGAAITIGVLAAFLIGLSRLVLDEHYVSDVVSGYIVGAVWALFGIWLAERGRLPVGVMPNLSQWQRTSELAVVVVGTLIVALLASHYQHNLITLPAPGLNP